MTVVPPSRARRDVAAMIVLQVVFAVAAAMIGVWLAGQAHGVAPLWLANAGIVALLVRNPDLPRAPLLFAHFFALVGVNLLGGRDWVVSLGLPLANVVEVCVACRLLCGSGWAGTTELDRRALIGLVAGAGIAAPALSAVVAAAVMMIRGVPPAAVAEGWFAADALGMILLAPLLLTLRGRDFRPLAKRRGWTELGGVLMLVGGITAAVMQQRDYPLLFLVIPSLLLAAFRLRFAGTALSVTLVAAIAIPLTVLGHGPIANAFPDLASRILFLQLFLATAILTALPIAAGLAERQRLIARLASNDRMFRDLTEGSPVGIFRADSDGLVQFANGAWTGLAGGTAIGRSWLDAVHDGEREELERAWRSAMGEFRHDVRTREGRWMDLRLTADRDADGTVGWVGAAYDIDERRRTAQDLGESARVYRLLADHSNDIITRIGLDGVRRYISPAATRILGFSQEELLGNTPIAEIHPDDRARVERVVRTLLDGAIDPTCTYRQRRADGHYAWLEATYRLVRHPETDEPEEFIAVVRDIGRRRQAEFAATRSAAQLEEANRLLQMAEGMAGIGHWRLDAPTGELFWSDEVYRIHGRAIGDLPMLDQGIEAYHPDDREQVGATVERALRDGTPWSFQHRIVRPDGDVRDVVSHGQAERAPNGEVVGLFGVFQDVTERARAEAALREARDAAQAATEAKSAFLATMSHEIRTPMSGVVGMIELLRGDPPAAERERFFDALEQSAQLLMAVLDDVLDFSKIDSRNLVLERIDFDLNALARNTLDLFHNAASRRGLILTMSAPAGQLWVRGDPTRVQQILSNLISNAVKFTDAGSIELGLVFGNGAHRRRVRFEVRDTGIGIAAADIERLFSPFVQADASTTRQYGGTGLGLAITRRLVEAMHGEIGVESVLGVGTTFWFEIEFEHGEARSDRSGRDRTAPSRPLSVLVAEDNQVNRILVAALVERAGHSVTCVENGQLAVQAATRERYDLILMDMQMPEMDGLAATRAIRAGSGPNANAPIVALTADAAPERRRFYEGSGLTKFLTKPIDADLLTALLSEIGGRPAGLESLSVPGSDGDLPDPAVDHDKLAKLEAVLGPANCHRLLTMFVEHAQVAPQRFRALAEAGNDDAVRVEAHSLKGAAASVGARRLMSAAAALEDAEIPTDRVLIDALAEASRATLAELDAYGKRRAS